MLSCCCKFSCIQWAADTCSPSFLEALRSQAFKGSSSSPGPALCIPRAWYYVVWQEHIQLCRGQGWRQQDPPRKFRKSTPWLFWLWQLSSFLVLHWILLKWDWKNYLWKEITERWLNDCILRESTDLQGHLHYWFFPLIDSSSECKRAILH